MKMAVTVATRALLTEWFGLMEAGKAGARVPDPTYKMATPERAAYICEKLDQEFEFDIKQWANRKDVDDGGYSDPPGFADLPSEQQVALVQDLSRIKDEHWHEHFQVGYELYVDGAPE